MKLLQNKKNGFVLLDALVSLLIFSFGIIGLSLFQGVLLSRDKDNDFRINATLLSENIIGMASAEPTNAACYVLNSSTSGGTCNSSASKATAVAWGTEVASRLPGGILPKIEYAPALYGTGGILTVTLQWKRSKDTTHNLVQSSQLGT